MRVWVDVLLFLETQAKSLSKHSEDQSRLGHGERCADAYPRSAAEKGRYAKRGRFSLNSLVNRVGSKLSDCPKDGDDDAGPTAQS